MGRVLVIAEKPSVGNDIAKALHVTGRKNGYKDLSLHVQDYARTEKEKAIIFIDEETLSHDEIEKGDQYGAEDK